jgi:hypothetical protein
MLVETEGVKVYTPGHGNFGAAKQERHYVARREKLTP